MSFSDLAQIDQLGPVIDETGATSTGSLIFTPEAWEQLLGRSSEDLVKTSVEVLRYLEQRMLFLRVTLLFAWAAEGDDGVGRIGIWGVRM